VPLWLGSRVFACPVFYPPLYSPVYQTKTNLSLKSTILAMADTIIVESYGGHKRRQAILWVIPLGLLFVAAVMPPWTPIMDRLIGVGIAVVWLALLVYFKILRKK